MLGSRFHRDQDHSNTDTGIYYFCGCILWMGVGGKFSLRQTAQITVKKLLIPRFGLLLSGGSDTNQPLYLELLSVFLPF